MERQGLRRKALRRIGPWLRDDSGAARIDRVFPAFLGGALVVVLAVSWIGQERTEPAAAAATAQAAKDGAERRVISSSGQGAAPVERAEGAAQGYVSDNYPAMQAPRQDNEQARLDAEVAIARQQVVLPEPEPEDDPAADPTATDAGAEGEAPAEAATEGEAAPGTETDGS